MTRHEKPKVDPRNRTAWADANDARGRTEIVDPEKGPSNAKKK